MKTFDIYKLEDVIKQWIESCDHPEVVYTIISTLLIEDLKHEINGGWYDQFLVPHKDMIKSAYNSLEKEKTHKNFFEGVFKTIKLGSIPNPQVVDFGCGFGMMGSILRNFEFNGPVDLIGVDKRRHGVGDSRNYSRIIWYEFKPNDAMDLNHLSNLIGGEPNVIFLSEVIHTLNVNTSIALIYMLWESLKDGGYLVIVEQHFSDISENKYIHNFNERMKYLSSEGGQYYPHKFFSTILQEAEYTIIGNVPLHLNAYIYEKKNVKS